MTPKSLARIRGILFMMDVNERLVLRNYLTCFESRKKGHKPKTLALLDLLEKYPDNRKVDILFRKKVPSADARRMVLMRLREKIFTSLTLDVNIAREETYDAIAQARASVAQGKIVAQLLVARGQREAGVKQLDRTIKIAKHYEFYHDLVEVLLIRCGYARSQRDTILVAALESDINRFTVSRDLNVRARNWFDEVVLEYGFKGLSRTSPEPERVAFIRQRAEELKKAYEKTDSATIGYFYHLLQTEYHQLERQLSEAKDHLEKLVKMVEQNVSLSNRVRLTTVYGSLAAHELWMHYFDRAEKHFNEVLGLTRPHSRNHALITEYLFYTQFYQGHIDDAKQTLESLTDNPNIDQSEHRKGVRNYLMACVEFCSGNFNSVKKFLNLSSSIGQDKEGWNIGLRILTIMNSIELEDYDHADSLILNLRQFSREGLKEVGLRERDRNVIHLLVELRKHSYDFAKSQALKPNTLKSLYTGTGDVAWQVQTPEMVCFHTWFSEKVNGKGYISNYSEEYIYKGIHK